MFEISLKGQTALITGSARGIGAEIARQMAKAGANIVINYIPVPADLEAYPALLEELKGYGVDAIACEADVSNEDQVKSMVAAANEKFGGVDILVNNAGITPVSAFEEMPTALWKKCIGIMADGPFYCTREVLPYMLEKKCGKILMITTNCTVNGGGGSVGYPAAKSAAEGIVRTLVNAYADKGIRANIIQPAVIDTDLFRQRYSTDEAVAEYGKKQPVGHVGKPVDIANAAVFLCSDKAEYICGATLPVDGARTYYKK
ncbi:MAG: SDR family oxidoreductase [Oscillospiraceae bacterium]|nr:SDR family oxidoreductase [Oscillospiraceae bacterium]MBQ9938472.1 SDR family oxidoreductase [Oscillospiraceae bacterium]